MKIKKIILLLIALQFFYAVSNAQIKLVGNITTNGVASYPTHIDSLGRGGYMSLPTATDRDAIPNLRRKYGMLVFVQADGKIYKLNAPTLTNADWVELSFGSSGSQYTDALARSATSLTVTGSSGAATYSSTTGVFNIPNYTLAGLGGSPSSRTITINGTTQDLSTDRSWSVGTVTDVNALTLGTNGTDITSSVANGTTSPTITLNIPTASASNRGALSAADFSIFNAKQSALTFSTGLTNTSNSITVNTSQNIATLSNLTSNGIVTTTGGTGNLSIVSTLPVANGGTGATTLTGVLKGNGTSALTAAVAGTDYQAPITVTTSGSGAATFSGTTLNIPSYNLSGLGGVPYTGATGPVDLGNYELSVNGLMIGRGGGAIATNSRIGYQALFSNNSGAYNTANGYQALYSNNSGSYNTANGYQALYSNNSSFGAYNTANGYQALYKNNNGTQNAAFGVTALTDNVDGSYNTANGYSALRGNTDGNWNTAIGRSALANKTTGSYNTAIGATADILYDDRMNNLSNSTAIGYGAIIRASNTIQLGADGSPGSNTTAITNVKTSGTLTAGAITYPNTAGTNGYYLTTDGSSTASWTAFPTSINASTILGTISISNGGTGSSAQNFVDLTTTQTVSGAKTFTDAFAGDNTTNPKISGFSVNINPQTNTTYTLAASDNGKIITLNNNGSITLTLPVLTAGFNCMIIQSGAGQVTLNGSALSGGTVINKNSFTKTAGVNSVVTIIYLTTNSAITIGDMSN